MKKSILITLLSTLISSAFSCTGIELMARDGSVINGRTAEFDMPIKLGMLFVPHNYEFKSILGNNGMHYKTKYAFVGANSFDGNAVIDGLNEKGLSVGSFYFPGYAVYKDLSQVDKTKALSPTEFPNWILSQFSSLDEVKKALDGVSIVKIALSGWGIVPPLHYIVYDKHGQSIVIEPIKNQLKVYDNPVGVITNSPTFDWQMTNLVNYINLSPLNINSLAIGKHVISPFGQGSGLHGIPGDFTPPSRFVRAVFFSKSAIPAPNAHEAISEAFHILNQFDIPPGAVKNTYKGKTMYDYTMATIVRDPQSLTLYYKTYARPEIKIVSLKDFSWESKKIKSVPIDGTVPFFDHY